VISKAAELIDPVSNSWDARLVQQTFNAKEAKLIFQIPIYDYTNDCIAWHFDKKGTFSVKSAYKVALDSAEQESDHGQTLMTHKYRGSQQSSREVLPKFIDSTQGEPKNICKP
jgi:hypothetical protein